MPKKSTIVDQHGQPFELPDLSEPQTDQARLASLHRTWSDHPSSGLTPGKLAAILRDAEQGNLTAQCELAEDVEEKDPHVQSELGKRRLALQGVAWRIEAPPNASPAEQRDAEQIQEILGAATWLRQAVFDCSDALLKGYANLELRWSYEGKTHYVDDATWTDPAWFQADAENRNELRLRNNTAEGEPLRRFGWIQHRSQAKSGYVSRRGLLRVLAWPFLFKTLSARDLGEFLEVYGLPIRLGRYSSGATEQEKATLLRAVLSIGHRAGGVIPRGMDIEFQQAASGSSDPYLAMIQWCEKSQSKAILGGTLTSQADGKTSTNALGNVHNEVRREIRDADLVALQDTLTRDLVYPLYVLNGKSFQTPRRHPRLVFDLKEKADISQFAQPLRGLVDLGVDIPLSWVRSQTGIPQPRDGEELLRVRSPGPPAALKQNTVAALKASPPEPFDELPDALPKNLNDDHIDAIRAIVDNAATFDEMRDQLLRLTPDHDEQTAALEEALTVAALAGRYDVLEDAL